MPCVVEEQAFKCGRSATIGFWGVCLQLFLECSCTLGFDVFLRWRSGSLRRSRWALIQNGTGDEEAMNRVSTYKGRLREEGWSFESLQTRHFARHSLYNFLTCTCMHNVPKTSSTAECTTYTNTRGLKNPGVGLSSPLFALVSQRPSLTHSSGLAWKYA